MNCLWLTAFSLALISAPIVTQAEPSSPKGAPWWHEAAVNVKVHHHGFERATANSVGCLVRFRLHFAAPKSQYADPKNAVRNYHRFVAQLRLGDKTVQSPVFANNEAGSRVYSFTHDTGPEGCWGKAPHKLRQLDVNACRGKNCALDAIN